MENITKVWNFMYAINHKVYIERNWEISIDFWVWVSITKIEVIWETPKKFKLKFTELKHIFNKVNNELKITEKLYKKEDVTISEKTKDLLNLFNEYKKAVKDTDRIADFKKVAILDALNRFTKEDLEKLK